MRKTSHGTRTMWRTSPIKPGEKFNKLRELVGGEHLVEFFYHLSNNVWTQMFGSADEYGCIYFYGMCEVDFISNNPLYPACPLFAEGSRDFEFNVIKFLKGIKEEGDKIMLYYYDEEEVREIEV